MLSAARLSHEGGKLQSGVNLSAAPIGVVRMACAQGSSSGGLSSSIILLSPLRPAARIERYAEEVHQKPPNNLCARQCPDELAHRLSVLLVPDLGNVADDIGQHTLV